MDLDRAMIEHGNIKFQFRSAIAKKQQIEIDVIASDCHCELGRWLNREGQGKHGALPAFRALLQTHRDFHKLAGRVAVMVNEKRYNAVDVAISGDTSYVRASQAMGRAAFQLKQTLKHQSGAPRRQRIEV
ncbi:MAG TPA: CZB domain-containing protein [Pseudomonadales bacterium]|nr:CZB domain-containing protein [Pseudomonadales bacterium]